MANSICLLTVGCQEPYHGFQKHKMYKNLREKNMESCDIVTNATLDSEKLKSKQNKKPHTSEMHQISCGARFGEQTGLTSAWSSDRQKKWL